MKHSEQVRNLGLILNSDYSFAAHIIVRSPELLCVCVLYLTTLCFHCHPS